MLPPTRKRPVPSPRVALSQNDIYGYCLKIPWFIGFSFIERHRDRAPDQHWEPAPGGVAAGGFRLAHPHFQKVSFEPDAVLVRSGDELDQVYFPDSGAIAFMVDMPDGQTVATTLMGREGALASFSVLGPSRSSVTAIARVAGTASLISAVKFRVAYARSAAIRHVVQVHARSLLLQLQHVAACNALHRVDGRMARWLLELHDRVPDDLLPLTHEALAQLLGVRRTTVTLTMSKLRAAGAIPSDRRGFVEVDRARLESVACECYALMQRRIDHMYCQELSPAQAALAPFRESSIVASDEAGAKFKVASPEGK